jgi:hypothetical protein
MKLLVIPLWVSLSSLCSGVDVTPKNQAGNSSSTQVTTEARSATDWCSCALTVEETIFLQQYDFE